MKKCPICGIVKRILITCSKCKREVCLDDFWIKFGLCADCVTIKYNEYYDFLIQNYSQKITA